MLYPIRPQKSSDLQIFGKQLQVLHTLAIHTHTSHLSFIMDSSEQQQAAKVQIRLTTRHADLEVPEDSRLLYAPTCMVPPPFDTTIYDFYVLHTFEDGYAD